MVTIPKTWPTQGISAGIPWGADDGAPVSGNVSVNASIARPEGPSCVCRSRKSITLRFRSRKKIKSAIKAPAITPIAIHSRIVGPEVKREIEHDVYKVDVTADHSG